MRRQPETVGAAFVCSAYLPDPGTTGWGSLVSASSVPQFAFFVVQLRHRPVEHQP